MELAEDRAKRLDAEVKRLKRDVLAPVQREAERWKARLVELKREKKEGPKCSL
jgi:hypothetical protein